MNRNKGFTLTELLVSMGVVATLVGILVPSLGKVREDAKVKRCATNIRSQLQSINVLNNDYISKSGRSYSHMSDSMQREIRERFWVDLMGPSDSRHPDAYIGAPFFRAPLMNCPDTREEEVTQNSVEFFTNMNDLVPNKYVGGNQLIFLSTYLVNRENAFSPDVALFSRPASETRVTEEVVCRDLENYQSYDDVVNGRNIRFVYGANHARSIKSDEIYGNVGFADGHVSWLKRIANEDTD